MSEEKKLVPKIRFKGTYDKDSNWIEFNNDWEQRKLGAVCERVTRKNKNGESDLPLTIASQYGLIDQRDFFNKVVAAKDMSNYYLLKKGEFAYNKSYSNGFDYGSIKRLNDYDQGCLSTLYICFGITSEDVESDYLECFFDTLKWYGDVSQICAEGARNHGLLNVDTKAFFDEVTIEMPSSKEEQRKISVYLNTLNNLITLHQRKLDTYKKMKQGVMQKLFNQEVRFKKDDGTDYEDWVTAKVSELFKITRGYVLPVSKTQELKTIKFPYPVYSSQTKNNGLMGFYSEYLYENAITWTTDGANAGTVNYRDGKFYCTNVCGVLLEDKIKPTKMIAEYLNLIAKQYVSYVGNPKLMNNVMSDIEIFMPSNEEERIKISDCLSKYDDLISASEQKLESYKKLKKAMLQKMFC